MSDIRSDSMKIAREIQKMAHGHYPDSEDLMEFYALENVVSTLCADRITALTPMIREIIEMLQERDTELVYNDLDNHACSVDWFPESYRIHPEHDKIMGGLLHNQNFSMWFFLNDYSRFSKELEWRDELYIYAARIDGPDYKRKTELKDFMNGRDQLYLDGRDTCFVGCSYRGADKGMQYVDNSNHDFHRLRYILDELKWLHGELKGTNT